MTERILFEEVQYFRQWWLWSILLGSLGLQARRPGYQTLVTLLVLGVFASVRLITRVGTNSLSVRFLPLHLRAVPIPLEEVTAVEQVTYNALLDYGGWGIRYGRGGKAYNISGNQGVRLTYRNGKHLLIGTERPDELRRAIESIRARSR